MKKEFKTKKFIEAWKKYVKKWEKYMEAWEKYDKHAGDLI